MKILRVIATLDPRHGGPAAGLRAITPALAALGHETTIVTLDAPGPVPNVPGCAAVHALGSGRGGYAYSRALVPWLRAHAARFDAVFVHGLWQYHGRAVWTALRDQPTPYFVFPHGMLDPWFRRAYPLKHVKKWTYWQLCERHVLRDAAAVVFTCEEERRLARRSFSPYACTERVIAYGTVAPAGDAATRSAAWRASVPELGADRYWLSLGRIHPKKGLDLLVRAYGQVAGASRTPPPALVLAGPCQDAGYLEELTRLAQSLPPPSRVIFPGMLEGARKWGALRDADVFVLPSHQENFGIAVVEALAVGTPVLISRRVNIWEEIESHGAGWADTDDVGGVLRLLQRWQALPAAEGATMRRAAQDLFNRRYEISRVAHSLVEAVSPFLPPPSRVTMKSPPPPANSADLFVDAPVVVPDQQIEFAGRFVTDGGEARRLWFRFPLEHAARLTSRADPFVIALLVHAMRSVRRLRIHGVVSDGLLANLADFQTAFAAFQPTSFGPVKLLAAEVAEPSARREGTAGITAFSGGVDSCFSLFRHTALSRLEPKRPLGAALMMHGFDIPLGDPATFARSVNRSRQLTDEAGLMLIAGATNLRTLPEPWNDTFATAVAASLAFFEPAFAFGLIPSFQEWARARFDHGSNPLTDPLLSSAAFQIVHDGAGYGRIAKLQHLTRWAGALRHLRVCWQGESLDRNCCRCEKCLRTMLMLRVCGVTACDAFPRPLDLAAIERLTIASQSGLDEFAYLLAAARTVGLREPWMPVTRRALRRSQRKFLWHSRARVLVARMPEGLRPLLVGASRRWLGAPRPVQIDPANPAFVSESEPEAALR